MHLQRIRGRHHAVGPGAQLGGQVAAAGQVPSGHVRHQGGWRATQRREDYARGGEHPLRAVSAPPSFQLWPVVKGASAWRQMTNKE